MNSSPHSLRPALLAAIFACSVVTPQALATTMEVLLAGNDLQLKYPDGSAVHVRFQSGGTYHTSTGSGGTWTLDGEALCTVRSSDHHASCGVLARNKSLGEAWPSTDANGRPVTVSVMPVP